MKNLLHLSTLAALLVVPTGCYEYYLVDGDDEVGDSGSNPPAEQACETVPAPWLPFPGGTSMGVTQKPGCGDHQGSLFYSYDFNVASSYETDNHLITVASSSGTVVDVVDWVVDGCIGCTSTAYNGGWGNCVTIQLDDSCIFERYCHLDKGPNNIFVEVGDHVCVGAPLGFIGSTGHSDGPHLHWQRETEDHQSVPVETFVEATVPAGCDPCTIPDNKSGCFASQNQDQCAVASNPCMGLQDGDYCGSNDELTDYPGAAMDLVTCAGGQQASVVACEFGCEELPMGTNDECYPQEQVGVCGNGLVEPGEQCDSSPGETTCADLGFSEGALACDDACNFDTGQCCVQAPKILNALYPDFTEDGTGCALDNGMQLKASAEQISESTIRFHVRKVDNSVWAQPATLTLYVGMGPTCGDPANVAKVSAPAVLGQITQVIDLIVDPYDAAWPSGQVKEFWVGKSESEYAAARSTGTISIYRECSAP